MLRFFLTSIVFLYGAKGFAQNFEYPITPIDDIIPIEDAKPICRITNVDERVQGTLAHVQELLACGLHKQARAQSLRLTKQIEQLMDNSGDLGTCWEERNCTGTVLKIFVTRSACKDLLGGKSWQQKRPEQGVCINL